MEKQIVRAERIQFNGRISHVLFFMLLPKYLLLATIQDTSLHGLWTDTL